jgi:hypothetical protein
MAVLTPPARLHRARSFCVPAPLVAQLGIVNLVAWVTRAHLTRTEYPAMPDHANAALIRKSKIGVELTDEQCATLSDVIEVADYADGDVVVAEGAIDDKPHWSRWDRPRYSLCSAPSSKGCSRRIRIWFIGSCAQLRALLTRSCIAPARRWRSSPLIYTRPRRSTSVLSRK